MEPGSIVEFFEEKRILCGVVLELKGERLHVLSQNRPGTYPAPQASLARRALSAPEPINPPGFAEAPGGGRREAGSPEGRH